jgi:ATP-dependent DNA helicase RecG
MHRNYRKSQPVQIIRYANRIEIKNPGHSLVPDDRLGEPGSLTRNEKIAAVLHELGFAETKGTGIRAMREAMEHANLTHPLFLSDREKDEFTVRLLVHHLLGTDELEWLANFKDCSLTDDDARALIVLRELGLIDNAIYRDANHVDTLTASGRLRRLRDLRLLAQKGKGPSTFYVPGPRFLKPNEILDRAPAPPPDKGLSGGSHRVPGGFPPLPGGLARAVEALGRRGSPEDVRGVIRDLCSWRAMQASHLAMILRRTQKYIQDTYLRKMIQDGELEYVYPHNPAHPQQAYRTSKI